MIKKAQFSQFSIFTFMIAGFLAVVLFAGLIWVMGQLNDVFTDVGLQNERASHPTYYFPCIDNSSNQCNMTTYVNMSRASEQIWGNAYSSIQSLRLVSGVYILALGLGIIVVGALERKHPFLFFIYILIVLLGVIFAPTISNAYESLLSSGIFDNELQNFTISNFLLLNLPTVVMIIGIMGSVFLFINLIRGGNEGNIN